MGELKATPGPWLVATSNSWRRIVNERGEPVCIPTIQRSDNHPDMEFPNGGAEGPDACMMAASPDLYEALQSVLQYPYDPDDRDKAIAALAKARGEQP